MQHIIVNNCQVSYKKKGKGKPVMLLHGFGEDHRVFNRLIDQLSDDFLVIAPDIPGSGMSEFMKQLNSLSDIAEVLNKIVETEGIEKFSLIGHSMGGYITLAYAEKYPDKLDKLGLFHSTALADTEEKKAGRLKSIQFIEQSGAERFLKEMIPDLFSKKTKEEKPELVKETFEIYRNFNPDALIQYYHLMIKRPERTKLLAEVNIPVLLILGEEDNLIPLEKGLELAKLAKLTYIEIYKKSGHMGMLEEPEKTQEVVRDFLKT